MQNSTLTILRKFQSLCVRTWKEDDINQYAELVGDPTVMKYISNGVPRDTETARREIEVFSKEILEQGWSRLAVSIGEEGPLIGYAGFSRKPYGIDFGMRFLPEYWGNPYTYISCCLALEYGFEEIQFPEIRTITNKNHQRGLSFMRKLFSSTPADICIGSDEFKMYIIKREEYMQNEYLKNRRLMEASSINRTEPKSKTTDPQESLIRNIIPSQFLPQINDAHAA